MHPRNVPAVTVEDLPADAVLLDVREDVEWAAGHIDGALHVPMNQVPRRLAQQPDPLPDRDATIIVICRVGARSAQVTAWLNAQGLHALNLEGGMLAWAGAGRAITADGSAPPQVL